LPSDARFRRSKKPSTRPVTHPVPELVGDRAKAARSADRLFPNRPPGDTDATRRVVFPNTVAGMVNHGYAFLLRHGDARRALPKWTARPLFFRHVGTLRASFREGFLAELGTPCHPPCLVSFGCVFSSVALPQGAE
jgi:hypothetical protein